MSLSYCLEYTRDPRFPKDGTVPCYKVLFHPVRFVNMSVLREYLVIQQTRVNFYPSSLADLSGQVDLNCASDNHFLLLSSDAPWSQDLFCFTLKNLIDLEDGIHFSINVFNDTVLLDIDDGSTIIGEFRVRYYDLERDFTGVLTQMFRYVQRILNPSKDLFSTFIEFNSYISPPWVNYPRMLAKPYLLGGDSNITTVSAKEWRFQGNYMIFNGC